MSRWFRFYDDAVNDPKLLRLSDAMHRAWTTLLCIASKNDGVLPPLTDVALMLRLKPAKVAEWLAVLTAGGLFDNNEGVFSPHNWNARQYKSDVTDPTTATRSKNYRDRKRVADRDGDRDATVTVTLTRDRAETEQRQNAAPAASPVDPEVDLFRRGKEVLGKTAGGMIKQLLDVKDGKTNLARAAIETAAGKENPREYVGKIIRNQEPQPGEVSRHVDGRL